MSEKMFEEEPVNETEDATVKKESDDEAMTLGVNIFCLDKWGKNQSITLIDLSSLDGVLATVAKLIAVVAVIKLIFGKRK